MSPVLPTEMLVYRWLRWLFSDPQGDRYSGGHVVMLVPVDTKTGRVRIVDPRFPDKEVYAHVKTDYEAAYPELEVEGDAYREYYEGLLSEKHWKETGRREKAKIGSFRLLAATIAESRVP